VHAVAAGGEELLRRAINIYNVDLTLHSATEAELARLRAIPETWEMPEKLRQTIEEVKGD